MTVWRWETREEWGAVPPKNRRTDVRPAGVVIHYPGGGTFTGVDHATCRRRMRAWQKMHMNRSNDLEYGLVLCEHLRLMEGRVEQDRPRIRVGSNGTAAANAVNSSIQLMRGSGDPPPTPDEIRGLAEAVVWLRKHGGWGPNVSGHRDHVATACPGAPLYAQIGNIRRMADRIEQGDDPDRGDREDSAVATTLNKADKQNKQTITTGVPAALDIRGTDKFTVSGGGVRTLAMYVNVQMPTGWTKRKQLARGGWTCYFQQVGDGKPADQTGLLGPVPFSQRAGKSMLITHTWTHGVADRPWQFCILVEAFDGRGRPVKFPITLGTRNVRIT